MAYFDDDTFDTFDALDFDAFDALDGLAAYSDSFYAPDVRLSTIADHLPFLVVYPQPDSDAISAADKLQFLDTYRGSLPTSSLGSLTMPSIQVYQYFVADIDERPVRGGSLSMARSITLGDGEITDQTFKVGPATSVKVWDKTENEAMGNFDFLWLEADLDVLVQFTTDAGTTDAYDVKELKGSGVANQMGPALVLGSDDTQLLDGSIDTFDGTADTIDEIWVHNSDSTNTARVRIVVAT